jgi:DUF971 family protein
VAADRSIQPVSIDVLDEDIVIDWGDKHVSRFDLVELRRRCTCAQCRELRVSGDAIWPRPGVPDELRVVDAELVGAWGLSLRWNDRHETGIYSWKTLREWCRCEFCSSGSVTASDVQNR